MNVVGVEVATHHLSQFRCSRNLDVENFLKRSAIAQEMQNKSRTYLIVDAGSNPEGLPDILAYFTLALHIMVVSPEVSRSMAKKLAMFYDSQTSIQRTPCYLIGQIGKCDSHYDDTNGDEILHRALDAINIAQGQVGGRFIKLDCEPIDKLIELYERNGFSFIQIDEENNLVEMAMFY